MEQAAPAGPWRWFLPGLIASTAVFKLFLAWRFPAFLTGDDLEVVETAAKYAVGLDYEPSGIRSLFHPLLLALPCVKIGVRAGLTDPRWLTFFAALPGVLFSSAGIWLLDRFARDLGWSRAAARTACFLYALHWLPLAYGATPFPRPISSVLLLGAFLLVARGGGRRAALLLAGALAACAFAVRWSEGLMLGPLVAFAWWRTRRAAAAFEVAAGFLGGAFLTVWLFDTVTLRAPLSGFVEFARLARDPNLGGFHPHPWYWYGSNVLQWLGPVFVLLILAAWRAPRLRLPLGLATCAVALYSLSPVKEYRYLQVAVPFAALGAALGWERLREVGNPWQTVTTLLLATAAGIGIERALALHASKSQSALACARFLHDRTPEVRTVVLEQKWAYGDRLYLGNRVTVRDVAVSVPLRPSSVGPLLDGADAVSIYERDLSPNLLRLLANRGFRLGARFQENSSPAVRVFLAEASPDPRPH